MRSNRIEVFAVEDLPEIAAGDDLATLIAARSALRDGDVVVIAQKIVSKAEGRVLARSREEAIVRESRRIVARRDDVLIAETVHGFVCANAGVDESNTAPGTVVLLPVDPDASAQRIWDGLSRASGVAVGVVIADTFGRPWRIGQTNVAIGVAGIAPLQDLRGTTDRSGRLLEATVIAIADEIAAAAELVMGKSEGMPVAIVRGLATLGTPGTARELIRPPAEDLFPTGLGGDPIDEA